MLVQKLWSQWLSSEIGVKKFLDFELKIMEKDCLFLEHPSNLYKSILDILELKHYILMVH